MSKSDNATIMENEKAAQPLQDNNNDSDQNERFARIIAERDQRKEIAARSRTEVAGGLRLKLQVIGSIPGYHLFWENDSHAAIEQLLYEGFDFVEPSEISLNSHVVADAEITHRISRYVGQDEAGQPLRAYLMKCPEDMWKEREKVRLTQADAWDNAIRDTSRNPGKGLYNPEGVAISVETRNRKD